MFDTVNGLPLHPLVVHGVVVLLPLGVLGAFALVLRPAWRRAYGPLLVGITAVACLLIPVATSSGEALEKRVGDPGAHAALGDRLLWFAAPLLVLLALLVWLDRRGSSATPDEPGQPDASGGRSRQQSSRSPAITLVAVLTLVAAVATGVQVYRVGDSGARAAWGDTPAAR